MKTKPRTLTIEIALAATLVYFVCTRLFHFPFLADDYIFLWKANTPGFILTDFSWLSKRPLSAVIDYYSYKTHLFEYTQLPFVVYFFFHCIGLLSVSMWIGKQFNKNILSNINQSNWKIAGFIGLFYPCFHELLYMATNLPYSLGLFFLGVALWRNEQWSRTLFLIPAFLSLETYVLPAFVLLAIENPVLPSPILSAFSAKTSSKFKSLISRLFNLVPAIAALLVYFVISRAIGSSDYGVEISWENIGAKLTLMLKLLWTIHFYKEQWIATFFENLVFALICFRLVKEQKVSWKLIFFSPLVFLFCGFQALLIPYYSPRAIHGASALKLAFFTYLFAEYLAIRVRVIEKRALIIMLSLCYFGQLGSVFYFKYYNYGQLEDRKRELIAEMAQCNPPCKLKITGLDRSLRRDFILPHFSIRSFIDWVKETNFKGKDIQFDYIEAAETPTKAF